MVWFLGSLRKLGEREKALALMLIESLQYSLATTQDRPASQGVAARKEVIRKKKKRYQKKRKEK
jgi:hypothetical protein